MFGNGLRIHIHEKHGPNVIHARNDASVCDRSPHAFLLNKGFLDRPVRNSL